MGALNMMLRLLAGAAATAAVGSMAGGRGKGSGRGMGGGMGKGMGKGMGGCRAGGKDSGILDAVQTLAERMVVQSPEQPAIDVTPTAIQAGEALACPQCGRRIVLDDGRPLANPHCPECGAPMGPASGKSLPASS